MEQKSQHVGGNSLSSERFAEVPPGISPGKPSGLYVSQPCPQGPGGSAVERTRTHHVHHGQHILLYVLSPMVFYHLGVCHHQRFHPLLLADGALLSFSLFLLYFFFNLFFPRLFLIWWDGGTNPVQCA